MNFYGRNQRNQMYDLTMPEQRSDGGGDSRLRVRHTVSWTKIDSDCIQAERACNPDGADLEHRFITTPVMGQCKRILDGNFVKNRLAGQLTTCRSVNVSPELRRIRTDIT